MFYAIDKTTNKIVLSTDMRKYNYKNTYNKTLRYICTGCLDNGHNCNDNNVTFVNSKYRQSHFRHSKNTECSASKAFKEFNIDFYKKWFDLFKYEYIKPYWFNINLADIKHDNNIIIIRYNHQNKNVIKNIESNVKYNNKIVWILSLENRKYDKIYICDGKIYIDFIGNKNDIPLYDNNKSIIYLDTGYNYLLKVELESYNSHGQEIKILHIKDFCIKYDELFISYPYRKPSYYIENILKTKKIYDYNYYINEYKIEYNYILNILNEYDIIIYNYYLQQQIIKKKNYNDYINEYKIEYNYILNILNEYDNIIYNYYLQQQIIKRKQIRLKTNKNNIKKLQTEKDENIIIQQKYTYYIQQYKITDKELLNVLLEIINDNYNKIKNVKDKYLHTYYIYITYNLNYDIFKMIKYILYQEQYI